MKPQFVDEAEKLQKKLERAKFVKRLIDRGESDISDEAQKIGWYGESIVYETLKLQYMNIYNNKEIYIRFSGVEEIKPCTRKNGHNYSIKQYTINCCQFNGEPIEIQLIWNNASTIDSFKANDLKLIEKINDSIVSKQVVEVKTTTKADAAEANFSEREIYKMQKYRNDYRLFRVSDVNNEPCISELKNPFVTIFHDKPSELPIISLKIRI